MRLGLSEARMARRPRRIIDVHSRRTALGRLLWLEDPERGTAHPSMGAPCATNLPR